MTTPKTTMAKSTTRTTNSQPLPIAPDAVDAIYVGQRLPHHQGNPLIEALPHPLSADRLQQAITRIPAFDAGQRLWDTHDRLRMLPSLQCLLVPMARHDELAVAIDTMLRDGYVGRKPRSPEHMANFQKIYELQQSGSTFGKAFALPTPQISKALVGPSGCGKTTAVKALLSLLPSVIHHPELGLYQITHLHIEMPTTSGGVKVLCQEILRKVDELIPGAEYFNSYVANGRTGADALLRSVARVLNMHCVGLIVADEVQNLANSSKGAQVVMTELVSACNALGVPILFIGTNKAGRVLSADFRQARRSSGGISHWSRLQQHTDDAEINEWLIFVSILWEFQWVRNPVELDEEFLSTLYDLSQGVIDIAVKLFISAQASAIAGGSETLTPVLFEAVYRDEMSFIHPMIDALRSNDMTALQRYEDIAPVNAEELVDSIARRVRARRSAVFSLKPSSPAFVTQVATSLVAAGIDTQDAISLAQEQADAGTVKSVIEASTRALKSVKAPRRMPTSRKKTVQDMPPCYPERPRDYRNFIHREFVEKRPAFDLMTEAGMAPRAVELFELL